MQFLQLDFIFRKYPRVTESSVLLLFFSFLFLHFFLKRLFVVRGDNFLIYVLLNCFVLRKYYLAVMIGFFFYHDCHQLTKGKFTKLFNDQMVFRVKKSNIVGRAFQVLSPRGVRRQSGEFFFF